VSTPLPEQDRWFRAEVQVHGAMLRSWLRGRFPALRDVDDVVQEAMSRVWQAHQAGSVDAVKAFLFTTAHHLAVDEMRRRQIVTVEYLAEITELSVYDDRPTAADAAARAQELELLTQAIQQLPDRCRQVLTLRKIYGLSQREIAAQLGITEHTVEAQIGNGMRRCADFLARHGHP